MAQQVCMGATMKCSFGSLPSSLIVPPTHKTTAEGPPAATIMDHIPVTNIPSFAICKAPTNPDVIKATAAAAGVLTPMPCLPVIPGPWAPGSPTVTIGGIPTLNNTSKCLCTWLGVIQISNAGTVKTTVP